ncbi:hypothetical protein ACHAXS_006311 [Conticribra weissflogii]
MTEQTNVRVGVGVLIRDPKHPNKIFAGLRKNSHGDGTLALPGGHLEMYESWKDCAIRETLEETGLKIHNLKFGHVTNDIMRDQRKHYVTVFMMGECVVPDGAVEEELPRPKNCHGWDSYSWDELKQFATLSSKIANGITSEAKHDFPVLFGPLLELVKESPEAVLNFLNNP